MRPFRSPAVLVGLVAMVGACTPAHTPTANAAGAEIANAAPDEGAILAVVDAFFLAMAAQDRTAFSAIVAPGATMVAIGYDENGARPPRRSDVQTFIDGLGDAAPTDRLREAYWAPTVLQRADLAVVWPPYHIDLSGKRLHCGIDVFNLSREAGRWLIDSVSFTMEPDACPELEPAGVVARPAFDD